MRRRFFPLRILALTIASLVVVRAATSPPARPNIILILSDDMGFSDIGCYGSEIATPALDALAASGVRFTQFYNGARCCPTRASLLTGLYAHQTGLGHMGENQHLPAYTGSINDRCATIAEVLRPAGYHTYALGKWHITHPIAANGPKTHWPLQRGFEKYYGTINGGGSFYDPTSLCRGNTFITPENDPEYRPKQFYYTDAIADNAIAFLKAHQRETASAPAPFFMYVAFTAAHWPMHALPEDIAKYRGKYDQGYEPVRAARLKRARDLGLIKPQWALTPPDEDWSTVDDKAWEARCMEVYAAMVDRMDQNIARLVAELKASGQFDNTLIFFLEDNGACAELMGRTSNAAAVAKASYQSFGPNDLQPKVWPPMQTRDGRAVRTGPGVMPGPADTYVAYGRGWANVSNTPFREYKHWVNEGGISTPLIVHWPAAIAKAQRGTLVDQPGHLIDIAATCVEVAGATYPAERAGKALPPLEGVSLKPALSGEKFTRAQPLFWEHEGNRAVRDGKWKLVAKGPRSRWELYDMEADRTELHDLASAEPARVAQMSSQWDTWATRVGAKPWPWDAKAAAATGPERIELGPKAELAGSTAPRIAGRGFTVDVQLGTPLSGDGVLVAQGGAAHGWAIFARNRVLYFVVRRAGKMTTAQVNVDTLKGTTRFTAALATDGQLTLAVGTEVLATADAGGLIAQTPIDGLQVGRDAAGAVGNYQGPFPYEGAIRSVVVTLAATPATIDTH
jgi:arylsulfatase A-like enzyme